MSEYLWRRGFTVINYVLAALTLFYAVGETVWGIGIGVATAATFLLAVVFALIGYGTRNGVIEVVYSSIGVYAVLSMIMVLGRSPVPFALFVIILAIAVRTALELRE